MPASLVQSHRGSPPPPPPPCPAPRPAHHQPTSTPSDAALAGALRRLRHVPRESIRDTSKVDLTAGPDAALVAAYQHQVLDANCEKWLPLLAEGGHTFASVFVPLTPQHAQMLMDMQAAYERTGVVQTQPPAGAETIYAELQTKVAAGMARLPTTDGRGDAQGPTPPCFAKTSSRSPKDAAVASRRLRQLYLNRLGLSDHSAAKFESGSGDGKGSAIHPPLPSINARLVALLQAGTEMLAMADAGEVLQTMGCSERIATDMRLALEHPQRFEEHIVLRQWVPLDVGLEFRGFVCGGRLTALSQYNHLARFAHVERLYPALAIAIREFFASHIRDTLAPVLDSYVIDFAVVLKEDKDERAGAAGGEEELADDDGDGDVDPGADAASADASARIAKIWVIEVNPFLETTDGALFSWQRDRDVIEGRRPFEFRQQTRQPTKATATQLQQSWRDLLLHPFA